MRQKYNPWVSLVALLLLAIILVFTCTGCTGQAVAADNAPRFSYEKVGAGYRIITDNETGNQYLYYFAGYGGGLTKLED